MKKIIPSIMTCLLALILLISVSACPAPIPPPSEDEILEGARYASQVYDIVVGALNKKSEANDESTGTASFAGEMNSSVRKGIITFNNFTLRNGFPTIKQAVFNIDLSVTETTVKGTISSDQLVEIENPPVYAGGVSAEYYINKFDVSYDLRLENSLWQGTMKGTVRGELSIEHDYDIPTVSKLTIVPLDADGNETTGTIQRGGAVKIKIGVSSNSPVNWLHSRWNWLYEDPSSSPGAPLSSRELAKGENAAPFVNVSNGYWEYEQNYTIPDDLHSGKYCWYFGVRNTAADLESEYEGICIDAPE